MQILSPGTRIGQYEIASLPMMGGMGVVYFALDHSNDGRPVALKTFRPELLPDRAARDRFLREGTAWIELGSHPHIVRCYKVEYIDPTAFLVLELVAKEQNMPDASLRSWLIPGHPLPIEQALLFALQIARGMHHATEKIPGFVHRDLKPENILVGADKLPGTNVNRLRVTDFGLVKTIADSGTPAKAGNDDELKPNQVQFTRGVGTPLYMAPEQWKGARVGVYTDVYALGCILYELLTGERAASGKSISDLQAQHCGGKLRALPGSLPGELLPFLQHCLALARRERYQGWDDVVSALQNLGVSLPSTKQGEDSGAEHIDTVWSYNAMGSSYLHMGKAKVALDYFEKVLGISRKIGDWDGERAALGNLGLAYADLGDAQSAIRYCEEALKNNRETGDRRGEGATLGNLGNAYADLGDVRRAIGYYEEALKISREVGDRRGEGADQGNLGIAYKALGDVRRAIGYYEEALKIALAIGDRRGEGTALNNLGEAYVALGEAQHAIGYYEEALKIAREIGNRHGEGAALGDLGLAHANLGDVQRAIGYYEEALKIAREIGNRRGEGAALGTLGTEYRNLGDVRRAIEYYEDALKIAREIGDRHGEGIHLGNLGVAYDLLGDVHRAIEYYEEALTIAREIGDRQGAGNALGNLGIAYDLLGDVQRAIRYYDEQLPITREIGDRRGEGAALGNLGIAYKKLGNVQRAIAYYEEALKIRREIGDADGVATDLFNMALLYRQQGNLERAIPLAEESERIFEQIGSPNAQHAWQLLAQLQDDSLPSGTMSPIQKASEAFQRASSIQECFLLVKKCPIYYRKSTHIENCYIKIIIKKGTTLLLKSSPFLSCTKRGDKIPNA